MLSVSVRKTLSPDFALDVTFSAVPGIAMLFGASGSGKTTLLRCLAGLLAPDAGRIAVGDHALFDSSRGVDVPVQQRNIGYVFQELALFPHMTIGQNIEYGLHRLAKPARTERARTIANSFRIASLLSRRPAAISGGERQRAALARALVMDPALLLLDEPLSGLDHAVQSHIMDDLRAWNVVHGIPILYVTHAHREVFALGDRVIVLEQGCVVADGIPHEVMDMPDDEPLAQLAGFENFFEASVIARRPDAGTMLCRLGTTDAELEVPLSSAPPGTPIRIAIRAGDILVANQEPAGLSARNILRGSLTSLRREGTRIVATVQAGERFLVHLTPGACESLGLAPSVPVWLIIKTHSCRHMRPPDNPIRI
jgi:molybdate transport system ATP-binding protein